MIVYLVTAAHEYTMGFYLRQSWGEPFRDRVRVVPYATLPSLKELPRGAWIFSDVDRLDTVQRRMATRVWRTLERSGRATRLLNDPANVPSRLELLQRLYSEGGNRFRAARADAYAWRRFPVFLRQAVEHTGSRTPLIYNRRELKRAKAALVRKGHSLRDLLLVEFCNTADEVGHYRKYSAFVVGGEIIPRYLTVSTEWMVKYKGMIVNEATVREELEYMEQNPHEDWLRETFRAAHVGYGRIDYGLREGEPQVWEINVNPMIGAPIREGPPSADRIRQQEMRRSITALFYDRFARALEALSGASRDPEATALVQGRASTGPGRARPGQGR